MDIAMILTEQYAGSEWTLDGENYSGLTWLSEDIAQPSLEELEGHWQQVQFDVAYARVQKERQAKYQAESDPVFFDFQRGEATEQDWLDAVQAVKDAHPYPLLEDFAPEPEPEPIDPDAPVDEPVIDEPAPEEV